MSSNDNLIIRVTTAMVLFNAVHSTINYDLTKNYLEFNDRRMSLGNNALTVGAGLIAKYTDDPRYLWLNSLILITVPARLLKQDPEF